MNELLVRKIAFGNVTYVSTATNATNSVYASGGYLPTGAIVTAIRYFPGGAITNGSNFEDATVNLYCGSQVLGTADRKASEAFIQTAVKSHCPVAADGIYVSSGGPLIMYFASSSSKRTGIAFDVDVYVDYLYCASRDTA
jgi:hypothetical protein